VITENTQGEELYYEVVGAGEPLLLVHGAAAAGSQFKQNNFHAELSSRFRVITLDLTGLGHSSRVASVRPAQWCDDVVNVLDAAGADRAHVYGVSLGARVAGRVALDYPARVISLTVDAPITRSTAGNARLSDRFSKPEEASPQQAENWRSMHG
jgi:pimeloyl-ACP methyl ester carboxylesterase